MGMMIVLKQEISNLFLRMVVESYPWQINSYVCSQVLVLICNSDDNIALKSA